ncbi:hypothetical protein CIW64_06065 [Enterobacter cloacae]|uniref:hypothetical protein n=1 Tax=Enterobacter sichuanensis TaxID=2071710 RepID=UPI000BA89B74|nr:hypothetical protein [Enterobacter sichuanensis]PAN92561.1 hypothetical protein CIW64_06065 [Enterobacter cloacae]
MKKILLAVLFMAGSSQAATISDGFYCDSYGNLMKMISAISTKDQGVMLKMVKAGSCVTVEEPMTIRNVQVMDHGFVSFGHSGEVGYSVQQFIKD